MDLIDVIVKYMHAYSKRIAAVDQIVLSVGLVIIPFPAPSVRRAINLTRHRDRV